MLIYSELISGRYGSVLQVIIFFHICVLFFAPVSRLEDVQYRVDVITDSSRNPATQGQYDHQIEVQLALKINDPGTDTHTTHRMCLSPSQLDNLISGKSCAPNCLLACRMCLHV